MKMFFFEKITQYLRWRCSCWNILELAELRCLRKIELSAGFLCSLENFGAPSGEVTGESGAHKGLQSMVCHRVYPVVATNAPSEHELALLNW